MNVNSMQNKKPNFITQHSKINKTHTTFLHCMSLLVLYNQKKMVFTMKKTIALLAIAATVSTSASAFVPTSSKANVATFNGNAATKSLPVAR